jgi:hypothetical protein
VASGVVPISCLINVIVERLESAAAAAACNPQTSKGKSADCLVPCQVSASVNSTMTL